MTSEPIQPNSPKPRKTIRSPRPSPEVVIHNNKPAAPAKPSLLLDDSEPAQGTIRIGNIVNDTLWLLSLIVILFTSLALISFNMADPAWSRSIPLGDDIYNLGGILGAYLADVGYYLFGYSTWWLIAAASVFLWKNLRPLKRYATQPYRYWLGSLSVMVLLLCSPIGEYLFWQQYFNNQLPTGAGGLVGLLLGQSIENIVGRTVGIIVMASITVVAVLCLGQVAWAHVFKLLQELIHWCSQKLDHTKDDVLIKKNRRTIQKAQNIVNQPVSPIFNSYNNRTRTMPNVELAPEDHIIMLDDDEDFTHGIRNDVSSNYRLPPLNLLNQPTDTKPPADMQMLQRMAELIETTLTEMDVAMDVMSAVTGPTITRFDLQPHRGVKSRHILPRIDELTTLLNVPSLRLVEKSAGDYPFCIELPNPQRQTVNLSEILTSPAFQQTKSLLTVALGKDAAGSSVVGDLAKMPNILLAGMEQSGKTTCLHGLIMSLLFRTTPDAVRLLMLDSPRQSLAVYNRLPHLLAPVVTEAKHNQAAIEWCIAEMQRRLRLLSHFGLNTLAQFNQKIAEEEQQGKKLLNPFSPNPDKPDALDVCPTIVLVISELAHLNFQEHPNLEQDLVHLVKKGRTVGFHLILSTQYPNIATLTNNLKANIATRMAFTVSDKMDSRAILDQTGAEILLGQGDYLLQYPGYVDPIRLQSAWISENDVQQVVAFIEQQAFPNYLEGLLSGKAAAEIINTLTPNANTDPLFDEAVAIALEVRKVSTSLFERRLKIGFNRAATLIEALQEAKVISAVDISGKYKVLLKQDSTTPPK